MFALKIVDVRAQISLFNGLVVGKEWIKETRGMRAYQPILLPVRDAHRIHGMFFVRRAVHEIPFDSMSMNMLESMAGFVARGMTLAPLADQGDRISE
jgi:hypothetical protein